MLKISSYFVALTQILMTIVLITFIPMMIIIRYFNAIKAKKDLKTTMLVVLIPFSMGYYLLIEEELRYKIYNKLLIIYTVMIAVGMTFTLFKNII